jgi:hypothetical protein
MCIRLFFGPPCVGLAMHGVQGGYCTSVKLCFRINFESKQTTNSTELSPSWEANSHSPSQEIPRLLWNPKVRFPILKGPRKGVEDEEEEEEEYSQN